MRIAVLSGKGGAGKTMLAANLAAYLGDAVYVDCDVEEPNGRLFLKPQGVTERTVYATVPEFDGEKCIGCRKCVKFCRFHALIYIKEKPKLFQEVCHSCGGCRLVCPTGAIREVRRPVGRVEEGMAGKTRVLTGILNPGEGSGGGVIQTALQAAGTRGTVIVDCPPGSACPVMESIRDADYCILVCEATAFGFHNFQMVHELASLMGKPCGVVVNKAEGVYAPLEAYCEEQNLPILARIPYRADLAQKGAAGELLTEDPGMREILAQIWAQIGGGAA